MGIKQLLLGTPLGSAALSIRETSSRALTLLRRPHEMAANLNDALATRLVTTLPCDVFLDVGAHIGSVLSALPRGTKLIAVEAMPDKAEALRAKFPRATVHACAVGEREGDVSFHVVPSASGYSSLIQGANSVTITVPLRRLDDLVKERVSTMKIDVEGAELGVLRGAERLIQESRPLIMFESAPGEAMYSKDDMWLWLSEHRYEVVTPDRVAHDGPSLTREGFSESHYYPRRTTNYFAIPSERRTAVRTTARTLFGIPQPVEHL